MNLQSEILREHSKSNSERITKWVGGSAERFDELMQLFLKGEYRVTQRAAWIVSYCADANPELIKPYISKMIERASESNVHQAVPRNVVRVLQFIEIPKKNLGAVVNFCFNALTKAEVPVAIKANAMGVLTNICKREPELKHEFKTVVEMLMPNGSPAIKARGRAALAAMEKL